MSLSLPAFVLICGSLLLIAFLLLEVVNWSKLSSSLGSNHNLNASTFEKTRDEFACENLPLTNDEICESVNIVTRLAVVVEVSEPLRWNGYEVPPVAMTMENTGDAVFIRGFWTRGLLPSIYGGPLKNSYQLHSLSLHWGTSDQSGSEHSIDHVKYPFEMQLVHVKASTDHAIIDEPVEDVRTTIVSYLFQITDADSSQLDPIIMNLCRIEEPNTKVYIPPFQLDSVLPLFERKFYSYNGKMNPPPADTATWIIHPEPLSLSSTQMEKFRSIRKYTSRPTLSLKDHELYFHE